MTTASSIKAKIFEVVKAQKIARREAKETVLVRARDDKGHFVPDDPSTPENEAFVEAPVTKKKAPAKKKKTTAKKTKKS